MAGLQLIGTYSSDSEDEDKNINNLEKSKQTVLPLPEGITNWKGAKYHDDNGDKPENHDGRVRSFQHERGNWATLVYIDYEPSEALSSWMSSVNSTIKKSNFIDQCHISLSKTLILKFHWIDSFVTSLRKLCQSIKKFTLIVGDLKIYTNEERTRTFLGIQCDNNDKTLKYFMNSLNKLLEDYQLPPFYEEASYHISFLWQLGDEEKNIQQLLPSMNNSLHDILSKNIELNHINVNQIYCKIGNKLYKFPLG